MLVESMILIIIGLIVANLIIDKKLESANNYSKPNKIELKTINQINTIENKPLSLKNKPTEIKDQIKLVENTDLFELKGTILATNQKVKLVSERLDNIEKVVTEIAEKETKLNNEEKLITNEINEIDIEKMDFRLKVIEQEIDNIKNPKPKIHTFYGKENDEMEETIKAAIFNRKR
ncbi:MAG: hypothetical protein PHQ98_01140 [Candidatus ainarchaeum sp.]|nr:hypothetical protein [Candidatus ainarchaeum sp.]